MMYCREIATLLSLLSCISAIAPSAPPTAESRLAQQVNISLPVDHFTSSDTRTYINRYWFNDTFYKPGGPIIIYDNGESPLDAESATSVVSPSSEIFSAPFEVAKAHNGLVLAWEHRYYGYSLPCPLGVGNLANVSDTCQYQYLTMDQAMEDVVYLAHHPNFPGYTETQLSRMSATNSPWIFIGGSYPGARAGWLRVRNPETIYASWASSAVVAPVEDGSSYFNTQARTRQPNCTADMDAALAYIDQALGSSDQSISQDIRVRMATAVNAMNTDKDNTTEVSTADADSYSNEDLTNDFVYTFVGDFQYAGPSRNSDLFCDFMEKFDIKQSPPDANITTVLSNSGNGLPTAKGLKANGADARTLANAYLYAAYQTYWAPYQNTTNLHVNVKSSRSSIKQREGIRRFRVPSPISKRASDPEPTSGYGDGSSWPYQVQSQFGVYEAWSDAYAELQSGKSVLSKWSNQSISRQEYYDMFAESGVHNVPQQPNLTACTQYGAWTMNPSNTMFTTGEWDPWRPFTPLSVDTEIGATVRQPTTDVPACNAAPDASTVFGAVWKETAHAGDLFDSDAANDAFTLFNSALKVWLPCFKPST